MMRCPDINATCQENAQSITTPNGTDPSFVYSRSLSYTFGDINFTVWAVRTARATFFFSILLKCRTFEVVFHIFTGKTN